MAGKRAASYCLAVAAFAALWCRGFLSADTSKASKPNIVILLADDVSSFADESSIMISYAPPLEIPVYRAGCEVAAQTLNTALYFHCRVGGNAMNTASVETLRHHGCSTTVEGKGFSGW